MVLYSVHYFENSLLWNIFSKEEVGNYRNNRLYFEGKCQGHPKNASKIKAYMLLVNFVPATASFANIYENYFLKLA